MKDIIKDFKDEGYSLRECIIYGVVAPLALIALCLLASYIESIFSNVC